MRLSTLDVNKSLLNLHKIADGNGDPQLCDYLEGVFLKEQIKSIKELADMVTQLNRVGEGISLIIAVHSSVHLSLEFCCRTWRLLVGPAALPRWYWGW